MEFSLMLRRLWRHRILVAVGLLVAAAVAVLSVSDVSFSPLKADRKRTEFGAAQTMLYVDTDRASLASSQADTASLVARAQVFARFINSGAVRGAAAKELGVSPRMITVTGPNPEGPGQQNSQPVAQQRANQLLSRGSPYSVFVDTEATAPTITLFTQARTGPEAIRLASAVTDALSREVRSAVRTAEPQLLRGLQVELRATADREQRTISQAERRRARNELLGGAAVIKRLGTPIGGAVEDRTARAIALLVFVAVALAWCVVILLVSAFTGTVHRR